MQFALWSVLIGLLLIFMALAGTVLSRLPLSTAMLYLAVGVGVSPIGLGWIDATPVSHTELLERLTEVVVLVSLFTAGLKLSHGLGNWRWLAPLRLATVSMVVTVGCVALAGYFLLGLPLGAAVLLGGLLAPTDPVLASDVQVQEPGDQDEVRFALTGEGGLNDGTAFPFVMLGLGLLGLHDLGDWGWRWFAIDLVWAVAAGLGLGAGLGHATGRLVLYLRREHKEAVGLDDFIGLGLIALAYGAALLVHAYGFLAVFAAGVAMRRLVQAQGGESKDTLKAVEEAAVSSDRSLAQTIAVDPQHAPAFMAHAMLGFNEQIERIGEVAVVVVIGSLLWAVDWQPGAWWLVPLLLLVVRPLSVAVGLVGSGTAPTRRWLLGWFGIRGIGSLYYLAYAINHGLEPALAMQLAGLTLSVVVASIVLHGVSVTPLMAAYERRVRRGRRPRRRADHPPGVLQQRQRRADRAQGGALPTVRTSTGRGVSMPTDTPKQQPEERQPAPQQRRVPDADMQAEDAGTADSRPADSGTAAESAMKQQSKTADEGGSGR